ncbi:MAG: selenocysteine-specific translation elongation factor [Termitinemataceae bacterium]|nr:MAG: selenocysteine-specific translation elongation factor [Termitinemataceae bacterium]
MSMEYPFIFGTAGHIDHGKTALVSAMTGVDCDRLEEEKRRGITIELGFAPLNLPNGKTVSIVDVPGHERFIRQMAAGAAGMDAAMLVIAASEGVMPQTREHLDILNLLGVRFGLVALTKKDLVDKDMLNLAACEALELIRGTCLEGAPVIPVSSLTGDGIPNIIAEIEKIIDKIPPRQGSGVFFMPVDRVFSKKGFGSVVTGTSYQGTLSEGEDVEIMPAGIVGRVRSLQTHGAKVCSVTAGQRVAINISNVSNDQLDRGSAICAKGAFIATDCIDAQLDVLHSASQNVMHWQRVRLHAGTADVAARISLLHLDAAQRKEGILPGHSGPVQILTESKIAVAAGQRFVIRFYSPLVTIGGGRVMLANAESARGKQDREAKAKIVEMLKDDFCAANLLAAIVHDRSIINIGMLFELSQMDKTAFNMALSELSGAPEKYGILEFGAARNCIASGALEAVVRQVQRILHEFHTAHPELSGLEAEKLYTAIESLHAAVKITVNDFKDLVNIMAFRQDIVPVDVQGKTCYRAVDFKALPLDAKFMNLVERTREAIADAGFNLLKLPDLEAKLNASSSDMKRASVFLREQDDLRTIEGGLLFSKPIREKIITVIRSIAKNGDITVAALRDAIGVNRKDSLAMLDFFDAQGLTKRDGDKRVLVGSGKT